MGDTKKLHPSTPSAVDLADLKSEIEKLGAELRGYDCGDGVKGSELSGLQEKTTFRQVLEEILFQVQALHPDFKGIGPPGILKFLTPAGEAGEDRGNRLTFGKCLSSGEAIWANTDVEYQQLMSDNMDRVKNSGSPLVEGVSIRGKTLEEFSATVTLSHSVVMEINNYLDVPLYELQHNWKLDNELDLPPVIEPGRREGLILASGGWHQGSMSYGIKGTDLRLEFGIVQYNNYLDFYLTPQGLPLRATFLVDDNFCIKTMTDKRWGNWTQGTMQHVVEAGKLLARAGFISGQKSRLQIDLMRKDVVEAVRDLLVRNAQPHSVASIVEGQTIAGKTIAGISEYLLGSYGYVLEFRNLLDVALTAPQHFLENGGAPSLIPSTVCSGGKEVAIIKMNNSGKGFGGLVTFRIGSTDLRLAILFQLFNNGNRFATAFIPTTIATDNSLFTYISSENQWKTSPDLQYARTCDSELVIQCRNLRARVTMTDTMKSVLTCIIKAT